MSVKAVTDISWAKYCDKWMHRVAALSLGGPAPSLPHPQTMERGR